MEFNIYAPVDLFIGGVVFLILFGIGLSLTPESFRKVFLAAGALFFGLVAQLIAFPVIAFCLVYFV
jgi:BASS family bile acid:Na+ symporter